MPIAMTCNPVLGRSEHANAANNVEELVKFVKLLPPVSLSTPHHYLPGRV